MGQPLRKATEQQVVPPAPLFAGKALVGRSAPDRDLHRTRGAHANRREGAPQTHRSRADPSPKTDPKPSTAIRDQRGRWRHKSGLSASSIPSFLANSST